MPWEYHWFQISKFEDVQLQCLSELLFDRG